MEASTQVEMMLRGQVARAEYRIKTAETELRNYAASVTRAVESTIVKLDNGYSVNELGELQGRSVDFDRACRDYTLAKRDHESALGDLNTLLDIYKTIDAQDGGDK